jgi:hypothetical protein
MARAFVTARQRRSQKQPKDADRDKVWSWSDERWELVTDAGPPGRVNAGGACDARRGKAVVAGGGGRSSRDVHPGYRFTGRFTGAFLTAQSAPWAATPFA